MWATFTRHIHGTKATEVARARVENGLGSATAEATFVVGVPGSAAGATLQKVGRINRRRFEISRSESLELA